MTPSIKEVLDAAFDTLKVSAQEHAPAQPTRETTVSYMAFVGWLTAGYGMVLRYAEAGDTKRCEEVARYIIDNTIGTFPEMAPHATKPTR